MKACLGKVEGAGNERVSNLFNNASILILLEYLSSDIL